MAQDITMTDAQYEKIHNVMSRFANTLEYLVNTVDNNIIKNGDNIGTALKKRAKYLSAKSALYAISLTYLGLSKPIYSKMIK